jgi:hypothetical protein
MVRLVEVLTACSMSRHEDGLTTGDNDNGSRDSRDRGSRSGLGRRWGGNGSLDLTVADLGDGLHRLGR